MGKIKQQTMGTCPKITKKLIDHIEAAFAKRAKFDPANPQLGQLAAHCGGISDVITYMKNVYKLQTQGPQEFAAHEIQQGNNNQQVANNIEGLRNSIRYGTQWEPPE